MIPGLKQLTPRLLALREFQLSTYEKLLSNCALNCKLRRYDKARLINNMLTVLAGESRPLPTLSLSEETFHPLSDCQEWG